MFIFYRIDTETFIDGVQIFFFCKKQLHSIMLPPPCLVKKQVLSSLMGSGGAAMDAALLRASLHFYCGGLQTLPVPALTVWS